MFEAPKALYRKGGAHFGSRFVFDEAFAELVRRFVADSAPGDVLTLVLGDSLSAEYGLPRGAGWVALLQEMPASIGRSTAQRTRTWSAPSRNHSVATYACS